ncbi:MAG: signal peptide peptidase SppA [Deltaproteobacteria bacterium]|nr:signal peptide peptidase SppA [Deltaproteobacteria bacterium]
MRPPASLALLAAGPLLALILPRDARAQAPAPRASEGIVVPSQSISATDDGGAIVLNPALLAFLPGPELRLLWVHTGSAATIPDRGWSLGGAVPLWIFATGLRLDFVRPPASAPPPFADRGAGNPFGWVRWAAALQLGELAAIGNTLAWSQADHHRLDDQFSVTTGLVARPSRFLSAAAVARDWNHPRNEAGASIDPSFDLGLAVRPAGDGLLELGGEASWRPQAERWVPKVTMAVDVPYVGRLRAGVEMLDAARGLAVASAGLDVRLAELELSGGTVFGSALTRDGAGLYAGAALRSFRAEPELPLPAKVVRIDFEATPGVRRHVRLLRTLWRLAGESDTEGVLLALRAPPADSLAHTEELIDAVALLRRRGKKVLCHLEDAEGRALLLCAGADRVGINPAGGVRFAGLGMQHFYFGGLLRRLGVRADFVRIGEHKLAPEQLGLDESSAQGRRDHEALLASAERVYLDEIGRGRGLGPAIVKQRLAAGPFLASEARAAGLVDALVYEDEIQRFAEEAFGRPVRLSKLAAQDRAPAQWRSAPKIAVVYLHGDMIDGESRTIPLLGLELAGSRTVARALKEAREDESVRAVVLRIETGGGSSLCADIVLREATLLGKTKPLVVSMGSQAASGGYYAAVAAREIYALRGSITGSIGIFYGKVDFVELLEKLGVKAEGLRTSARADAESLFRPFTDEERRVLGVKVKQFYDLFVARVAEGRKLRPAEVDEAGRGRVFSGEQALSVRLIDRIGGLRQALGRARSLAGLPADAALVELPEREPSLLAWALEAAGVPSLRDPGPGLWELPPARELARLLAPFALFEPHQPLARTELLLDGP